ncbi:DUF6653 family protein [Rubripirellula tenax]|uniref:DUF6653 family protein n=1 Tax=Rubripirellula tenax TaxID=2528015 RepID=UPI0036F2FFA6
MKRPHPRVIGVLSTITSLGAIAFIAGLATFNLTATLTGLTSMMLGKLWFVDRMGWIWWDIQQSSP